MSLAGLRKAVLRTGKLDLIVFDACRMAFVETLVALDGISDWFVGTPLDLDGFDHMRPLRFLAARPAAGADEVGEHYVRAYPERPENRGRPGIAASLLSSSGARDLGNPLERVFAELNALGRRESASILEGLRWTENEDGDLAVDLFELLHAARERSDRLRALADPLLAANGRLPGAERYLRSCDPGTGACFESGFPRTAWVRTTAYAVASQPHSGLSITCPGDLEAYRAADPGREVPEWLRLCRGVRASRSPRPG
jgi:hypothetical protein